MYATTELNGVAYEKTTMQMFFKAYIWITNIFIREVQLTISQHNVCSEDLEVDASFMCVSFHQLGNIDDNAMYQISPSVDPRQSVLCRVIAKKTHAMFRVRLLITEVHSKLYNYYTTGCLIASIHKQNSGRLFPLHNCIVLIVYKKEMIYSAY